MNKLSVISTYTLLLFLLLSNWSVYGQIQSNKISVDLGLLAYDYFDSENHFDKEFDWDAYIYKPIAFLDIRFEKPYNKSSIIGIFGLGGQQTMFTGLDIEYESEFINNVYTRDSTLRHNLTRRYFTYYTRVGGYYSYFTREDHRGFHISAGPEFLVLLKATENNHFYESRLGPLSTSENASSHFNRIVPHIRLELAYAFKVIKNFEIEIGFSSSFKSVAFFKANENRENPLFSRGLKIAINYNRSSE